MDAEQDLIVQVNWEKAVKKDGYKDTIPLRGTGHE